MIKVKKNLPRLAAERYVGEVNVCFTLCVADRVRAFTSQVLVERLTCELGEQAKRFDCLVPVYCFMPDHLHVMLCGQCDVAEPRTAIERFKLRTGRLAAVEKNWSWQSRFYDHVIRVDEDGRAQARYIAQNPLRAGLIGEDETYPFLGSIGYDLADILWDACNP